MQEYIFLSYINIHQTAKEAFFKSSNVLEYIGICTY